MPDDQKKLLPINYTHREFETIRSDLQGIAERLYPDTFKDFSEASFGSLMLDAVAYVGDQLSFYLDYNVNECFLDTAYQFENVVRHGRILGYKYGGRPSTFGKVALYVMVPASATGIGPDTSYIPLLKKSTTFSAQTGLKYLLLENVDFADPKNTIVVARVNEATGAPTWYAVKAYGNVVSGFLSQNTVTVGDYERYKRVRIPAGNISEIISVTDSQGHEYFEVDYLAQDMVYKELPNVNFKNDNVPSVIKPYLVSRKYTLENDRQGTYLQFGSGKAGESNVVANPQNVAIDLFGKDYVTDTTFDPTRLSKNESLGVVPSNTTLTIVYRATNPSNSNIGVGVLNQTNNSKFEFEDVTSLNAGIVGDVKRSLEVSNEEPITGVVAYPNSSEVKRRIYDTFPTQNRAVTQADYENVAYRMPAKFGSISRISVQRDPDSLKRNLNLYVLSINETDQLVKTNSTIKNNLKTWLNQYRMMNDTIDILDPYIVNIGINFVIKAEIGADKYVALNNAVNALQAKYKTHFFIGEPLYISDIYQVLKNTTGVLDVLKVKLTNPQGTNYSSTKINIEQNLSPDGSYLIAPQNAILELKFPQTDIKGKCR
tara:strand:+ start:541 stop:2337 length:1797 start_codon:yes stop_codon:yes gene_type:complete